MPIQNLITCVCIIVVATIGIAFISKVISCDAQSKGWVKAITIGLHLVNVIVAAYGVYLVVSNLV